MSQSDEQLSRLLKCWHAIEPRANFEVNVHRRLRQLTAEPTRESWWLGLFWQPAFSVTAALLVAITIGAWTGVRSTARPEAAGFLAQDTLTARYLGLTK